MAGCNCNCSAPMCAANAGSVLNCVFNDIGSLIKPFAPSINQAITGKPQTVSGLLGNLSTGAILLFGVIVVVALFAIDHK